MIIIDKTIVMNNKTKLFENIILKLKSIRNISMKKLATRSFARGTLLVIYSVDQRKATPPPLVNDACSVWFPWR